MMGVESINKLSPLFIEVANGVWSVLSLCVVIMFALYVVTEIREHGWNRQRLKAAVALTVYHTGSAVYHGTAWLLRYELHLGLDGLPAAASYALMGSATVIASIGALCVLRVFSPAFWGEYGWVVSGALAVAIALIVTLGVM